MGQTDRSCPFRLVNTWQTGKIDTFVLVIRLKLSPFSKIYLKKDYLWLLDTSRPYCTRIACWVLPSSWKMLSRLHRHPLRNGFPSNRLRRLHMPVPEIVEYRRIFQYEFQYEWKRKTGNLVTDNTFSWMPVPESESVYSIYSRRIIIRYKIAFYE